MCWCVVVFSQLNQPTSLYASKVLQEHNMKRKETKVINFICSWDLNLTQAYGFILAGGGGLLSEGGMWLSSCSG